MIFHYIITMAMASSIVLSVDGFQRRRIKTFSAVKLQRKQDDFNSNEYGFENAFEGFGGPRFLQASMSMPPTSGGGQGTNSGSQSSSTPAAQTMSGESVAIDPPVVVEQTTQFEQELAPIHPDFLLPENDIWKPFGANNDSTQNDNDITLDPPVVVEQTTQFEQELAPIHSDFLLPEDDIWKPFGANNDSTQNDNDITEDTPEDFGIDAITEKAEVELTVTSQENAVAVDVVMPGDTEGSSVATPQGTSVALPEDALSNLDSLKKTQDVRSDDKSNNLVLIITISCGCALIALGAGLLIHKRLQNPNNGYDYYNDTCIRCVKQDDENVIENSLEDQMGRNSVNARAGSNEAMSTIHIRNAMEDVDLEDVHICRSDPCPTCNRARKVFMTDV